MSRGNVEAHDGARDIRGLSSDNEQKDPFGFPHAGDSHNQFEWQWSIAWQVLPQIAECFRSPAIGRGSSVGQLRVGSNYGCSLNFCINAVGKSVNVSDGVHSDQRAPLPAPGPEGQESRHNVDVKISHRTPVERWGPARSQKAHVREVVWEGPPERDGNGWIRPT